MKNIQEIIYSSSTKYCFIDLETFNLCLNFVHNRPWQVGILNAVGDREVNHHDILVNWHKDCELKIGDEAARITRYDHSKLLREGIMPAPAFEIMKQNLDAADVIVGHHILGFDIYLIKEYAKKYGADWRPWIDKIIDTKSIAQGVKLKSLFNPHGNDEFSAYQWRMSFSRVRGVKTSLGVMGRELAIQHDYDLLHDAIVDLRLNLKVWNQLKHKFLQTS